MDTSHTHTVHVGASVAPHVVEAAALALFTSELLDPTIELVLQKWEGPQEFTSFSKLPKEVQAMVWKLTLPGPRLVCLDPWPASPRHARAENHIPLPISLRINQSSRKATLESYCLVYRPQNVNATRSERPLCFDVSIDRFEFRILGHFDVDMCSISRQDQEVASILGVEQGFERTSGHVLDGRDLEEIDEHMAQKENEFEGYYDDPSVFWPTPNMDGFLAPLMYFGGLTELILEDSHFDRDEQFSADVGFDITTEQTECGRAVMRYLQSYEDIFPNILRGGSPQLRLLFVFGVRTDQVINWFDIGKNFFVLPERVQMGGAENPTNYFTIVVGEEERRPSKRRR